MRIPALLLLAAIAVLGGLYAFGVFDGPTSTDPVVGVGPTGGTPTSGTDDATGPGGLAGTGPTTAPPIESRELTAQRALLLVAPRVESWNESVRQAAVDIAALTYATWYTERWSNAADGEGPGSGAVRGLDPLGGPPDGNWLDDHDIAGVFLDRIDPNALPASFWDRLATRVADGRTGLWVRMDVPPASGGTSATVHPLLTHPVLAGLLPVADPTPFEGEPLPGVLKPGVPPKPTEAGLRHPASRLVGWPRWSRHWWNVIGEGVPPALVGFCYPVGRVESGAEVLLEVADGRNRMRPALVASPPGDARVLWQGWYDFTYEPWRERNAAARLGAWMTQALAWVVGEPEPSADAPKDGDGGDDGR